MASEPSEPSQPQPTGPSTTTDPAPPLSPDGTVNNDTADPSFDPSSLDPDIDMNIDPSPSTQLQDARTDDPTNDSTQQNGISIEPSKQPVQKDVSLKEFLEKMDDYTPIIPDAVTSHHLLLAGLPPDTIPQPLSRLLALATQKFIADIAADAYQYSRMRASGNASATTTALNPGAGASGPNANAPGGAGGGAANAGAQGGDGTAKGKAGAHVFGTQRAGYGGGGGGSSGRAVLTMEDLGCAVGEYGVNVKRAEFYR
ncbi:MAG: hypothetical protein Q9208_000223 [Pyrenodesmia sp. 3 TL-2023]